ncbi:MAG: hypothetical protein COB02_11945 [Candidatus Cloacimonadota bacterium]|nr:MAG: hypothetical protein COB02_11945 [Candidatus Cloacimonadota bacterium]
MKLATFWIDKSLFAVDILLTREISPMHQITHVSKAPPYVLGLINLRGQIITVVDPAHFLHNTPNPSTKNCRFLIITSNEDLKHLKKMELIGDVKLGKEPLAVKIDKVDDVIDINEDQILPPPSTLSGIDREMISGVVEINGELVVIMNMPKFVAKILNN